MTDSGDVAHSQQADGGEAESELAVPWLPPGGITAGLPEPLGALPTFAVHDDNRPADSADHRLWVGTFETDEPMPRVDLRQTDLHYGEGVTSDATRTGREIGIPVCDDDGRELGEMRLSYANAGVLGAILTDAAEPVETTTIESVDGRRWTSGGEGWVEHRFDKPSAHTRALAIAAGDGTDEADVDAFRVALTRGERWPLDSLTDPMVDVLYGELAMLRARQTPDVQQRQGAALANQAMEIGELLGLTDRSRDRPEQYHGNEWLDLGKAVERLAAANAAIGRVRALADALRAENEPSTPSHAVARINAAARILAALDDTPEQP